MANQDDSVVIPDHKILSVLGHGGMARVYLARDEAFDRLVAVKVIDSRFSSDEQFQKRFEREAKTAGGLSHPNIVPVHRYGLTQDRRPYLTMAYLDGGSLKDRMKQRGAMSVDESLGIIRQIASALHAAHTRSVVHRDLKPDNVMFQGQTAYLTDFGIAKLLNAVTELTGTGLNPGTVRYFSPEQAQERAVDARSDIYALGILLFEMLTGRSPIEANTMVQMIMRIVYTPPTLLPDHLRGLQPFMDILLAKDPADRLGSCQEVVDIIDAMMRNWTRYGDASRLTDGVIMHPSGHASPSVDMDDDGGSPAGSPSGQTVVPNPFEIARQQTEVRGRGGNASGNSGNASGNSGNASGNSGSGTSAVAGDSYGNTPADDITGLTDLAATPRRTTNPSEPRPELSADTLMKIAVAGAETKVRTSGGGPKQTPATGPTGIPGTHTGDTVLTSEPRATPPSADASTNATVVSAPARPTAADRPASATGDETVVSRVPDEGRAAIAATQTPAPATGTGTDEDGTGLHAVRTPQASAAPATAIDRSRRAALLGLVALLALLSASGGYWWTSTSQTTSSALPAKTPKPADRGRPPGQVTPPAPQPPETTASSALNDAPVADSAPVADDATLTIDVTPADAVVTLVGRQEHYSPGMTLKAGKPLKFRISARGFQDVEKSVTLAAGRNSFDIELQPAAPVLGSLCFTLTPGDAQVTLQDAETSYACDMQLPVDTSINARVSRTGYRTQDISLKLKAGGNRPRVTLAKSLPPPGPPGTTFRDALSGGGEGPKMVVLANGSVRMGEKGSTKPPASVRSFAAGVFEVTFDDFDRFTRATGRSQLSDHGSGRAMMPVVGVSWNEAKAYTQWLSEQTGRSYRLLTETEWEFATRAGTATAYWWGNDLRSNMVICATCGTPGRTMRVDSFGPNKFKLYNTLGNVGEWVNDCSRDGCASRVVRGGSFLLDADQVRSSSRQDWRATQGNVDIGFRVAAD